MPIDCEALGTDLGVDGDIVFGRLYYHLDKKYGYREEDETLVPLFRLGIGQRDRHVVHFPLLASVLAELREEKRKYQTGTAIGVVSVGSAIIATLAALLTAIN